ncbi:MAG: pyridoxamine 5'-phosphate oxidase family protein [Ilumatobacteraceae bacterium]
MPNDAPKPLADLVDARTIVMLMTMVGAEHSSRPLTCLKVDDDRLSFLVDRSADWVGAIADGTAVVHATVADGRENTYVAMNGGATVTQDSAEIDELWNPVAGIYFDGGKEDPNVAVLHLDVDDGEYWDGPSGRIGAAVGLLRAKLSGDPTKSGDRGEIATDS